jgi:cytochrome c
VAIAGALTSVVMMDTIGMTVSTLLWAAALMLATAPAIGQDKANTDAGQLLFNNACRTCHTLRDGDNRLGPNLHRIIGRKAGSLAGYGYSDAMKNADLVWDKATLDRFIANPDQVVPGNNMKPYGGHASADERATIIAFLEASGAN